MSDDKCEFAYSTDLKQLCTVKQRSRLAQAVMQRQKHSDPLPQAAYLYVLLVFFYPQRLYCTTPAYIGDSKSGIIQPEELPFHQQARG